MSNQPMAHCPDETTLRKYLDDELDQGDDGRITEHIESCPTCQQTLDQLDGKVPNPLALPQTAPSEPVDEPPPHLDGYEVLGRIDAGGMGVVWRVRDLRFQRHLALKVMKARASADPEMVQRFI